jgi:resuscitation-promoting factor RpfB
VNKISLSWFRKRLVAAVVILASVIVQACSSGTANPTTSRNPNKTEASVASPECDPNYSGCVPVASDVDCAGGNGNGPAYVKGPVKVIGKDIYRLDRDGNGIGCE